MLETTSCTSAPTKFSITFSPPLTVMGGAEPVTGVVAAAT